MMDQEVKAKWVAALRSDQYGQGTGMLARVAGDAVQHCCLGVLCEVVGVPRALDNGAGPTDMPGRQTFDGSWELLPDSVMYQAGLYDQNPEVSITNEFGYTTHYDLAEVNDSGRYTFAQIADIIEEQL